MIQNLKYFLFSFFLVASLHAEASLDSMGIKVIEGQKFIIHKVDAKETLYSIARRYHVSVADITEVNEAEKDGFKIDQIGRVLMVPFKADEFAKAPTVTSSETGSSSGKKHTISAGETLYSLSKKYNVSTEQLKKWNSMESNALSVGEQIWVTKPSGSAVSGTASKSESKVADDNVTTEHIVDFGETIYSISKQYDVSQKDIMTWNRLADTEIAVGQKLIIKSEKASAKKKDNTSQYATNTVQTFHNAKKGEDYQSVAEMYGLKTSQLKRWNNFKSPFKGGEVIKIVPPEVSEEKDAETAKVVPAQNTDNDKNVHIVASGETIYSLSDKYGVEMEDLRKWNGMDNYQLSVGQKLYIRNPDSMSAMADATKTKESKVADEPSPADKKEVKTNTQVAPVTDNPQKQDTKAYFTVEEDDIPKIEKVKEKGVAEVIAGSEGTEKYLALHRTAKIGTIMQVRNDLNDQIVFVRVLGKLPNTGVDDKVIIRISKKAFEKLGGVDYKFPVEISYLPLKD